MAFSRASAIARLAREYEQLIKNPIDGIVAGPVSEDNLFKWDAIIRGPEGSP